MGSGLFLWNLGRFLIIPNKKTKLSLGSALIVIKIKSFQKQSLVDILQNRCLINFSIFTGK